MAATPVPTGLVALADMFIDIPEPSSGARHPALQQLEGRLLAITPETLELKVPSLFKNDDGSVKLQDRMTAKVIFLDGAPITQLERRDEPARLVQRR